ncbi:MAG TPA: helix-turn-helix domain-containing protein [Candidatus Dormibacteraeota bacterium]|nr:helix-turn-helix domain-containing protein [Candidatus Dormibacteraeota bacterium]
MEAAAVLGISRTQIYSLMKCNQKSGPELGYVKIGQDRRIPASQVQAYVVRLEQLYIPAYLWSIDSPKRAA